MKECRDIGMQECRNVGFSFFSFFFFFSVFLCLSLFFLFFSQFFLGFSQFFLVFVVFVVFFIFVFSQNSYFFFLGFLGFSCLFLTCFLLFFLSFSWFSMIFRDLLHDLIKNLLGQTFSPRLRNKRRKNMNYLNCFVKIQSINVSVEVNLVVTIFFKSRINTETISGSDHKNHCTPFQVG